MYRGGVKAPPKSGRTTVRDVLRSQEKEKVAESRPGPSYVAPMPTNIGLDKEPPMTSDRLAQAEAARMLGPLGDLRGRITLSDGRIVSARLLARNFVKSAPVDFNEAQLRAIDGEINKIAADTPAGGRRKHRGGGLEEVKAMIKAAALYAAYKTADATGKSANYFKTEVIDPIFGAGSRVTTIVLKLADQLVVKTPTTAVLIALGGVGFTANVVATITGKFNTWARGVASAALTDEVAERAAQVAVGDFKAIARTAGVAALIANQVGIFPIPTVTAAILAGLKITVTNPVARANVIVAFYSWYIAQDQQTRAAINAQATEYANAAKSKTAAGVARAKEIAVTLAPYLVVGAAAAAGVAWAAPEAVTAALGAIPGATQAAAATAAELYGRFQAGGINAYQAIAAAVGVSAGAANIPAAQPAPAAGVPPPAAPVEAAVNVLADDDAVAAAGAMGAYGPEIDAAVAAAEAAAGEGAAAAAAPVVPATGDDGMGVPPQGGRKHRKTKKRAMRKRRMTRRRPIFSY